MVNPRNARAFLIQVITRRQRRGDAGVLFCTSRSRGGSQRSQRLNPPLGVKTVALALLLGLTCMAPAPLLAVTTGFDMSVGQTSLGPSSKDPLFTELEQEHGPLQGSRQVNAQTVGMDFYQFHNPTSGVGLSLDFIQYSRDFLFKDPAGVLPPETLHLRGQGLIYTLKLYKRWGAFTPYFGFGGGNFYVRYAERSKNISYLDSAPAVWAVKLGAKLSLGHLGLIYEGGIISAPINVRTRATHPQLELGGRYVNIGLLLGW